MRAVLDTNVILASKRSQNPASPNREIIVRWLDGEFTLLFTDDILLEYIEKLSEKGIPDADIIAFTRNLLLLGEKVIVGFFHLRHFPADPDDIMFVLCALNGGATHLVSYDVHLRELESIYSGDFTICGPLDFLAEIRNSQ